MNTDEQRGFLHAIDRIIELCSEQANNYAKIKKELQEKHRESIPFHYRALALIDFKLYIEQLFKLHAIESKKNDQ